MPENQGVDKSGTLPKRLASVDAFRGFAIISMILVNFSAFFDATPSFLKHARGQFITLADIVAPLFFFVLGMMYRKSITRRVADSGRRKAYLQCVRRYLLVLILGVVGGCVGKMTITLDWGVLQAIGLAGLVALPFMELGLVRRVAVAAALLLAHCLVIVPFVQESMAVTEQGGPQSALAWAAIVLLSSAAGDLLEADSPARSIKRISILGLALIGLGLTVLPLVPVSKSLVTPSYALIATGISAVTFVAFVAVADLARLPVPTLAPLGRNALLIFLAHYVLVRIAHRVLPKSAGIAVILMGAVAIYALCYLLAWALDRKRIYLKL
jgi:predicted acyltransferase